MGRLSIAFKTKSFEGLRYVIEVCNNFLKKTLVFSTLNALGKLEGVLIILKNQFYSLGS